MEDERTIKEAGPPTREEVTSPPANKVEAATSTSPMKAAAMTRPPKEAEETSLYAMAAEAAMSIP